MNIPKIHQKANVRNALSTATHQRNNSKTSDVKHIQFRSKHTIITYHKHDKTTMLMYDSGADRNYLSEKERKS